MTHASEFLSFDRLSELIQSGHITRREHPQHKLLIYNYTAKAQYERLWTPETMSCRGLILDEHGNVIARPFTKFFNIDEHQSEYLPDIPLGDKFEAYEKLDGSLGISYTDPTGKVQIATRGAFASEQALWASAWWDLKYSTVNIPSGETWLFEIIYPENRIVVDYGSRRDLVLLARIDNQTGRDLDFPDGWPGPVARRYDAQSVDSLIQSVSGSDLEGFVLRFPSTGQRVKVKLDEYVRLHRLITQCTSRSIWEVLASGQDLTNIIDHVPDEFYAWVKEKEEHLRSSYREIHESCAGLVGRLSVPGDRKATALAFQKCQYPGVMFKMLDGRDPSELIWKLIRPEHERPFRIQHETSA